MKLLSSIEVPALSWLESLSVFKVPTLKLFLLVTLKAMKELYKALLYSWPRLLTFLILVSYLTQVPMRNAEAIIVLLTGSFFTTLFLQGTRPSSDHKNMRYWFSYNLVPVSLFLITLFLWYLPHSYRYFKYMMFIDDSYLSRYINSFSYFISPFILVVILFMFDAQRTLSEYSKALLRGVKLVLYNIPFFLVFYTLFYFSNILIGILIKYLGLHSLAEYLVKGSIFISILFPFYVCFITNFYIKRVHEQFSLYY